MFHRIVLISLVFAGIFIGFAVEDIIKYDLIVMNIDIYLYQLIIILY